MADYAVGDLHGCREQLERLLAKIRFDATCDRLWCTGDLVNRGPDSIGVMRLLRSLGGAAQTVLGNHDLYLLGHTASAAALARAPAWVHRLTDEPDAEELRAWLIRRPVVITGEAHNDAHHEAGAPRPWLLTHAGVHPQWSRAVLEQIRTQIAAAFADDAEHLLQLALAPTLRWDDGLEGLPRAGCALGYLTRMRHLHADGSVDLSRPAEGLSAPTPGWFEYPLRILADSPPDMLLLFGHWAALNGHTGLPQLCALDTGAVWGNRLTALRLQDQQYFNVPGWDAGGGGGP